MAERNKGFCERVEAFKARLVREALRDANGVASVAAKTLGLNRTTVYELIDRYELRDRMRVCYRPGGNDAWRSLGQ